MDLLVPLDKGGTPQHVIPAQAGIQDIIVIPDLDRESRKISQSLCSFEMTTRNYNKIPVRNKNGIMSPFSQCPLFLNFPTRPSGF
jgi:hypothetical protein